MEGEERMMMDCCLLQDEDGDSDDSESGWE